MDEMDGPTARVQPGQLIAATAVIIFVATAAGAMSHDPITSRARHVGLMCDERAPSHAHAARGGAEALSANTTVRVFAVCVLAAALCLLERARRAPHDSPTKDKRTRREKSDIVWLTLTVLLQVLACRETDPHPTLTLTVLVQGSFYRWEKAR